MASFLLYGFPCSVATSTIHLVMKQQTAKQINLVDWTAVLAAADKPCLISFLSTAVVAEPRSRKE